MDLGAGKESNIHNHVFITVSSPKMANVCVSVVLERALYSYSGTLTALTNWSISLKLLYFISVSGYNSVFSKTKTMFQITA